MDIAQILANDIDELLDEDLSMFEEELAIGSFDPAYRARCLKVIEEERAKRKRQRAEAKGVVPQDQSKPVHLPSDVSETVLAPADKLSPYNKVEIREKTPFQRVEADVTVIRRAEKRKSLFREYLDQTTLIDEQLLDGHLSFFDEWEVGAILKARQFSEEFLDKYFAALDGDKIAKTQLFSEEFFMRHFKELDPEVVLKKGKNPWCKKENRSRKLDMFLRIKGVRL